jgi:hypothetical protein
MSLGYLCCYMSAKVLIVLSFCRLVFSAVYLFLPEALTLLRRRELDGMLFEMQKALRVSVGTTATGNGNSRSRIS